MDLVNVISSLAGYSTAYSNVTPQNSGLNASTVDKIKRMENLTNASMSATSCFIGLNAPVLSNLSASAYVHEMAAILREGTNSVFDESKHSYTSNPFADSYVPSAQADKTSKTEAKTEAKTSAKTSAKSETSVFTPEQEKMIKDCSDAFAKRHASDKAEAKEENKKELMELVKKVAEMKANPQRGCEYFFNYADKKIAELEGKFTKDELREIYLQIEKDSKPKYEGTEKLPQNNGQNAAHKIQAERIRAQRIKNPKSGSKLAILRAQLNTVEELAKKGQNAHGYLPSKPALEKQIREIESGEAEAVLEIQIQKLEEETKDYGETSWYNFGKNSKLKELEALKEQKANLF